MALGSYNTVTVGTSATQIVASNTDRKGLIVANTSGTATLYVGPNNSVSTTNGLPVGTNGSLTLSGLETAYRGDVFGISNAGNIDVRYWEWI